MKRINKKSALRVAVIAEWVLIIIAVVASFMLIESLPEPLLEYRISDTPFNIIDTINAFVLLASIAASVGLYFFKSWARQIYTASTIWLSVSTAFGGPIVELPIASSIEEISLIVSGLIIGISYFSGIECFNAQQ